MRMSQIMCMYSVVILAPHLGDANARYLSIACLVAAALWGIKGN
jgi:hypothetical protein